MKFRVKDLSNGQWVKKYDDGELSPTAEAKKDATVFEGERWLGYWRGKEGVEIMPLGVDELLNQVEQTGLTFDASPKYNIRVGDMWVVIAYVGNIQVSARRSEAKVFTEEELGPWRKKPGYEIVEIVNPFGIKGDVTVSRFPGF